MSHKALFQVCQSSFDPSFWERLYDLKLNILRLDAKQQTICAYGACSSSKRNQPLEFRVGSHEPTKAVGSIHGTLINVNTVEEFKDCDKKHLLRKTSLEVLYDILTKRAVEDPDKLLNFLLLTFADLKTYRFTYWLGVPAFVPDQPFTSSDLQSLKDVNIDGGSGVCLELYRTLIQALLSRQEAGATSTQPSLQSIFALKFSALNESAMQSSTTGGDMAEYQMQDIQRAELLTLAEVWDVRYSSDVYLVVSDPSSSPTAMGWVVRNLLAMLALHHTLPEAATVRIIGLRGLVAKKLLGVLSGTDDIPVVTSASLLNLTDAEIVAGDESVTAEFTIEPGMFRSLQGEIDAAVGASGEAVWGETTASEGLESLASALEDSRLDALNVVGWEINERGKPGPRVADLSQAMDSKFLMEQAVDLNLRLMKWRLWPSLDTDRLSHTKCLLLGAGTLGCAVARALLGWGVRDITLVDNGRVSYSNPARQCLFEFEDAESRAFKAPAAAARLRKIFPGVRSEGVVLSIPMPGHPLHLADSATAELVEGQGGETVSEDEAQYRRLDELVRRHDVCFALTDSREARWLPTVLCAMHGKLLINSALGFDTYLVMRHGQDQDHGQGKGKVKGSSRIELSKRTDDADAPAQEDGKLGCYFCNDIVAATNSQKDRSLDQQCTVTRPGLSFVAAALAVELMVALLHRTDSGAEGEGEGNTEDGPEIPHQIRGSVAGFTQFTPHSPAFSCCTACSRPVVDALRTHGFGFVREVCADSSVLERTSGVSALMERVDEEDPCFGEEDDF